MFFIDKAFVRIRTFRAEVLYAIIYIPELIIIGSKKLSIIVEPINSSIDSKTIVPATTLFEMEVSLLHL